VITEFILICNQWKTFSHSEVNVIEALIHGKVSSQIRRHEDILTSNVFGLLSYLDWHEGLGPWLSLACRIDNETIPPIQPAINFEFWPSLRLSENSICEPDVLIKCKDGRIIILECKLFSGPSGEPTPEEDSEVRGQLGKQWKALRREGWLSSGKTEDPTLNGSILYVTADWVMPKASMKRMIEEINIKENDKGLEKALYWISWRSLAGVLSLLQDRTDGPRGRIQNSLACLMKNMDLADFSGFLKPSAIQLSWVYRS
jgi:hypothetical protein